MSGGAYDYAYREIYALAATITADSKSPREAFKKHLLKVALACKAIEYIDSGDGLPKEVIAEGGTEDSVILDCLGNKFVEELYAFATEHKDNPTAGEILLSFFRGECMHLYENGKCVLCDSCPITVM